MSKKMYLLLFFVTLATSLCHVVNVLPTTAENMFGWIFTLLGGIMNAFLYAGWIYYFFISYRFFKFALFKAFLFSVIGLSLWWGFDIALYFTIGYVDDIGILLLKWMAIYNYTLLVITWAITGVIYLVKSKKKQ